LCIIIYTVRIRHNLAVILNCNNLIFKLKFKAYGLGVYIIL